MEYLNDEQREVEAYQCDSLLCFSTDIPGCNPKMVLSVGLENSAKDSAYFAPVARLLKKGSSIELTFSLKAWSELGRDIDGIDEYFDNEYDHFVMERNEYAIKLTANKSEKIVVIAAGTRDVNYCQTRTFVFTKNGFNFFKREVRCIDVRIGYLLRVTDVMSSVIREIGSCVKKRLQSEQDSQYIWLDESDVYNATRDITPRMYMNVYEASEAKNLKIPYTDVCMLLNQLVTNHAPVIVHLLNDNVYNEEN